MSSDDFEVFKELRAEKQAKRNARALAADTAGWSRFSLSHYYLQLDNDRIDWWPSANKWALHQKGKPTKYYRGGLPKDLRLRIEEKLNVQQKPIS